MVISMEHPPPLNTALFMDGTIDLLLISGSGPANNILLGLLPYSSSLLSSESSPEPPPSWKLPVTCKDAVFLPPCSALSPSLPSDWLCTLCPYLQPAHIPNDMVLSADLQLLGLEDEASSDVPLVWKISKKKNWCLCQTKLLSNCKVLSQSSRWGAWIGRGLQSTIIATNAEANQHPQDLQWLWPEVWCLVLVHKVYSTFRGYFVSFDHDFLANFA